MWILQAGVNDQLIAFEETPGNFGLRLENPVK